jgi:hypothetical protein
MIDWSALAGKLVSMIMSWMTAGNLRNRMYRLEEENEIMRVGLADIQRMDPEGRMGWYAKSVLDNVDSRDE